MEKYKHMRWWPRPWEYRQAEAWLTDMAAKGWRLESIGLIFAKFIKAEPASLRYHCVLQDPSMQPSEEEALFKSYKDVGWKSLGYWNSLGYRKNIAEVFIGESEIDYPTYFVRQERLARKRIWAKVIWLLISVLVFVASLFILFFDTRRYLNTVLHQEILFSIAAIWLINYWIFSLADLVAYHRRKIEKPKIRPGKLSSAAWVINVVLFTILFMPGSHYLIKAFMEERSIVPRDTLEEVIDASQAPFRVYSSEVCYATDGLGVLYPYHRTDVGQYKLIPENENTNKTVSASFTFVYYRSLFSFTARQLGERLSGYIIFFNSYTKLNHPMPLSDQKYGFDRLWTSDYVWRSDNMEEDCGIVVTVYGRDVYYLLFKGPITSDQLIKYLQQKAGAVSALSN